VPVYYYSRASPPKFNFVKFSAAPDVLKKITEDEKRKLQMSIPMPPPLPTGAVTFVESSPVTSSPEIPNKPFQRAAKKVIDSKVNAGPS
jgi:hypothetical protein